MTAQPPSRSAARRALPAVAFLVGLALLATIVWWRVIHRSTDSSSAPPSPTPCPTPTVVVTVVPPPRAVSILVLNSTQRGGLAGGVAKSLKADGFVLAGPAANDLSGRQPVAGVAEIRYGTTGQSAARLLSFYVPGATLVPLTTVTSVVDVALGAKFVAVATTAAVTAAMHASGVTESSPAATPSPTTTGTSAHAGVTC